MKYDAFISYRHAELDLYIAKKLHKGLETFKVPHAIAKKSGKKILREYSAIRKNCQSEVIWGII